MQVNFKGGKKLKKNNNPSFKNKVVNKSALLIVILMLSMISASISVTSAADSGWTLTQDGRSMKAYSGLKEFVWQKPAAMAPNGPYDLIGLHRLVKTGITPKAVVFMIPGLYGSGERLMSNPITDSLSKTEDTSQCIYWANRGFDVYSIDFRSHFIPINFSKSQLSFTLDWGLEQYINDIKEAVEKAKEVSGAQKAFMAGTSWGGILAQVYASKYWQQDLRGLILLDPAPPKSTIAKNQNLTNSYNLTASVNALRASGGWAWENPQSSNTPSPFNPGYVFLTKLAAENPGAPAQYPNGTLITTINPRTGRIWANITEFLEYQWNSNKQFNTYGGYSDITFNINMAVYADRYYPVRVFLEYSAMADWTVYPYLAYDFLLHINEVNVPVIAFRSGLNVAAYGDIVNKMATTDFTTIMLPNYGHGDVFQGTYCWRDVSEPSLQWMLSHMTVREKADLQGYYRDWAVMLYENRLCIFPPAYLTKAPSIHCLGSWDSEWYASFGMTPIDAAKPVIDAFMSCPYIR
jgi:pimeloyl-ACP methyl ester carboxylesterase